MKIEFNIIEISKKKARGDEGRNKNVNKKGERGKEKSNIVELEEPQRSLLDLYGTPNEGKK